MCMKWTWADDVYPAWCRVPGHYELCSERARVCQLEKCQQLKNRTTSQGQLRDKDGAFYEVRYTLTLNPQPSTLNPQPSTLNPQSKDIRQALFGIIPGILPTAFAQCSYKSSATQGREAVHPDPSKPEPSTQKPEP